MTVVTLDTRRITLGGSTIGAAVGIDPWCSPIRLWLELTGRLQREESEAMQWGKRLQPVILEAMYDGGWALESPVHDDYPDPARSWLVGHPDHFGIEPGYRIDQDENRCVIEAKASRYGYDSPPPHYLAQAQTYMHLTGRNRAAIATLSGLHLDVTMVEREQHHIDLLLTLAERFMRHVWDDVQPPPQGHPDDRHALALVYPDATHGHTIPETTEIRDARRELKLLQEREKAQAERIEHLRATITDHMGDAETLLNLSGDPVATWKNVTSHRLDVARLRAEHPRIAAKFSTETTTRRFTLT